MNSKQRNAGLWLLGISLSGSALPLHAATYQVGEIVQDFTLTDRATRQPMKLSDFEGKIVFLDWFAWWCPFCQAAAPQLLEGIDRHYATEGGNPAGIPVVHVGVNLQPGAERQTQTFVDRAGLELVLEDFDRRVASKFASSGQPIFAIINGVANSPSHRQWELVYSQLGYGQTQFPIEAFRSAIDAIQKPVAVAGPATLSEVRLAANGDVMFTLQGTVGGTYHIESSTDLQRWEIRYSVTLESGAASITDQDAPPERRFYRAVAK